MPMTIIHLFRSSFFLQTGEEPSALSLANFLNLKLNLNGLAIPHWYCPEPIHLLTHWFKDFQSTARQYLLPTKVRCFLLKLKHYFPSGCFIFRFYPSNIWISILRTFVIYRLNMMMYFVYTMIIVVNFVIKISRKHCFVSSVENYIRKSGIELVVIDNDNDTIK